MTFSSKVLASDEQGAKASKPTLAGKNQFLLDKLRPGQFRVFEANGPYLSNQAIDSVERIAIDAYIIEYDNQLHATVLSDRDGKVIGAVLGDAFDVDTGERPSSVYFSQETVGNYREEVFDKVYEKLFGSFIIFIMIGRKCFMYLDAGGSKSAVYSMEPRIAGATAAAILSSDEYQLRFRRDLYTQLDVVREGWFASGLTAHRGVSRLMCNHRLDLQAWSAIRHWPVAAPQRSNNETELLTALTLAVRSNLHVILDNFRAALSLTGGGDSRALLSLLRERSGNLVTYVVAVDTPNSKLDVHLSSMIAKKFGLDHRILAPFPHDPEAAEEWHFRCGHVRGGINPEIYTALRRLVDRDAVMDGLGAEFGRCFFWKESDKADTPVTAEAITRRFGMPISHEIVEATDRWLSEAPSGDAFFTLDLAYQELRNSAWSYANSYEDPTLLHFSPFSSRRSVNALYELPVATKRSDGYRRAMIQMNWPELATIPSNKYGDVRDLLHVAKRLTNIPAVKKKLRKIIAP